MRNRHVSGLAAGVFAALTAVTSVSAQEEIIRVDFDANQPGYTYPYHYAGGGNMGNRDHSALASSAASTMGNGRGGGNALTLSGNFSQVPIEPEYNYYGIGGGIGVFRYDFGTGTTVGLPSGNLADYTFSIDLSGTGFTTANPVPIEVQLMVPDDRFTPDGDTNMDPYATVRVEVTGVTTSYNTYTFRLNEGVLTYDAGRVPEANRNFAVHHVDISLVNTNTQLQADFGSDNDNSYLLDNLSVTVVPEPGTALLLPAALALGLGRQRRSHV